MHERELLHCTIWLLIGLSAMETQASPPLTCDDISCQNNNACQVRLVNGVQVTDARCHCQGQWTGEKCELRMYLSILRSTSNSVTLHVQAKTWPPVATSISVYQPNVSEMTLLIKSLKTPYQCRALLQSNVHNGLHLKDLNENESYIVCLTTGLLDSCSLLDSMDVTKQSNCLLFEHKYGEEGNNLVGIVLVCITLTCCLLMSIITICKIKHHLIVQLLMNKLCCMKKKVKLTRQKELDDTNERSSEICMPSDLSMELLSCRWAEESNHPISNTRLHSRHNDHTVGYGQIEYEDLFDLYSNHRVAAFISKIPPESVMLKQPTDESTVSLRLNRFQSIKPSRHLKHENNQTFQSNKLILSEMSQSSQTIDSVSQYFNHNSYKTFADMSYGIGNNSLPKQRPHQKQTKTFSYTLPSTKKSKGRPLSLPITPDCQIKADYIYNTPPLRPIKDRFSYLESNQLSMKFSKIHKHGNNDDVEFQELQSPISEERTKSSKKKSFTTSSASSSSRSVSRYSGSSIFEGHPSEHNILPFGSNDNYDEEEDITETTSVDLFSDLSSSTLGFRDSILSYEDDTSNLVTPFETQSDSDNDTYKDIDSLNCSMETLQAFLVN